MEPFSPLLSKFWTECLSKEEFKKLILHPWENNQPDANKVRLAIAAGKEMYPSLRATALRDGTYDVVEVRRLLEGGKRNRDLQLYEAALQDYFAALWRLCNGDPFRQPYDIERLSLLDTALTGWEKCASWIDQDRVTQGPFSSLWIAATRLWIHRYPLAGSKDLANIISPLAYALRRRGKRTAALGCIAWALDPTNTEYPLSQTGINNLLELQDLILRERHFKAWNFTGRIASWRPGGHIGFKLMSLCWLAEYLIRLGQPSLAQKVVRRAMSSLEKHPGAYQRSRTMVDRLQKLLSHASSQAPQSIAGSEPLGEILEAALQALLHGRTNAGLVLLVAAVEAITLELWIKHKEVILKNPNALAHIRGNLGADKNPEDYFPGPSWNTRALGPTLSVKNYVLGVVEAYGSNSAATKLWIDELIKSRNKLAHGHLTAEVVEHTTYRLANVYEWYVKTVALLESSRKEKF